ncbi:MAG: anthrax toxin-like adenylyl cyclase domain-containing protein, partial [Burkholderiaceae bacterium]
MAVYGLMNSFLHPDNGMTQADMEACKAVANATGEVIIFRSTGSWSLRWIEQGYPTKNFHVKGKSSDWGPQAGFVPRDGKYSKVGADGTKAADGTAANQEGLDHHYAGEVQLKLTRAELQKQIEIRAGSPRKLAISSSTPIPKSEDLRLLALRTGDNKEFYFRAVWSTADNAF